MGRLLTTGSTIQCAHGATAILFTDNRRVSAGARVLLVSDTHKVVGCTFTTGGEDSPCKTIEWSAGANKASVGGTAPLTQNSLGRCKNDEGVEQGVALVVVTQQRASAR